MRYVAGAVQVAVGVLFLGVVLAFVIPMLGDGLDASSLLSFGFAGLVSIGMIALGVASFVYVARKDAAYWSAENLPDVAFTVHENGLTLPDPEGSEPFEVPWRSVRGMKVRTSMIRFQVDPAALPKKYYGQFAFGRSMLDQVPQTISTAMRVLSDGRAS